MGEVSVSFEVFKIKTSNTSTMKVQNMSEAGSDRLSTSGLSNRGTYHVVSSTETKHETQRAGLENITIAFQCKNLTDLSSNNNISNLSGIHVRVTFLNASRIVSRIA